MPVPFTRLVSQAIDNYGDQELYDNLARFDGIVAYLGTKGNIVYETGGQPTFRERILYGQNTNVAFRGKNAQIPTVDDDGITMAAVNMPIIDGAIVVNQVELDQVAGNSQLGAGLIKDKIAQFNSTYIQVCADAFRQAVPGANDPYTLLPSGTTGTVNGILIARTPAQQSSDASVTAGISRAGNPFWQNQYSTTAYDLTATSGRRGLYLDVYAACTRGASKMFEPDFGIAATVVQASLGAAADNNRRGTYSDDAMMRLGYDNIMFYNAAIIRDSSTRFLGAGSAGKIALLNSRALRLKVLKGQGKVKTSQLDENNNLKSLPINWKHEMQSDIDSLNYVTVGYCVMNLVPKSLQDLGLADNCS